MSERSLIILFFYCNIFLLSIPMYYDFCVLGF